MTVTVKNIIPRKEAEGAQTAQYTAVGCKTIIDKFTATNHAAVDVEFSVNLVAASAFAGVNNQVLRQRTIAPGECYLCPSWSGRRWKMAATFQPWQARLVRSPSARLAARSLKEKPSCATQKCPC